MRDALLDLLLGSSCEACGAPGRALCPACWADLPRSALPVRPRPCPVDLAPTVAAGEYGGALSAMIVAHKERGRLALVHPLGALLAVAAAGVLDQTTVRQAEPRGPVVLVPVPSRRRAVRARGHDPMLRVGRAAAARLRGAGAATVVVPLLRTVRAVRDQAGLTARGRAENLAGSMTARSPAAWNRRDGGLPPCVVVDDVLTTGATVREAQRALETAGVPVAGIATVAATRRRHGSDVGGDRAVPGVVHVSRPFGGRSLPFSDAAH